ncbi:MAG: MnhB domain-containing protein [Arenicellales bacterium]|jgi:multisubunit Na+/H+ antiporter MnhB subunit
MIELLWSIFDITLVLLLLALAWNTCSTRDVMRAVTLFIAMGLLLAIIWARLKAPDLALAEAVIGAGISGALLLSAIRDYPSTAMVSQRSTLIEGIINILTLALTILMSWAVWHGLNMSDGVRLSEQVISQLPVSGVSNPVTAVLLNFRAYDTLLELAVVLTAVLTVLTLNEKRAGYKVSSPLLQGMTRWLVPLLVVTSGYLLWVGAHAPGGAFQAGAMLAAAMILLQLAYPSRRQEFNNYLLKILLVIGIFTFVLVGLWMMSLNDDFLGFTPAWAGSLILIIETAATVSIATALTLAYLGGRPKGWEAGNHTDSKIAENGGAE